MPTPESSRSNLEHARRIGRVKFWRARDESQRVKAQILQAYFAVPQPSQRAVAHRLRVTQPYLSKLYQKIRREGAEKAVGREAYELYRALRDAELTRRNEALVAQRQRSPGQTTPSKPADSQGQAKADQGEGPTEYVELVRSTTGELIELYGSRPYQPPRVEKPLQQASNCQWVKGTVAAVVPGDLSHVDAAILASIGYNPNRTQSWF